MAAFALFLYLLTLAAVFTLGYKVGWRFGSRDETKTMIDLLDSLKLDCWEQTVFRDRFKGALQWTLDRKRKKDRYGGTTPPSNR